MAIEAYVFADEADAQTAIGAIEQVMRMLLSQIGYHIDENGKLIGHLADTGQENPEAARTDHWDIPLQLSDGRWRVASYRHLFTREIPAGHSDPPVMMPLWQVIDSHIPVQFTYEDISGLLPPQPPED